MPSLLPHLNTATQSLLFDELNYLNMGEIRAFCKKHSIPYTIWIEASKGDLRKTSEGDRKGVVLDRIRRYLTTGNIPEPTCFPAKVVCIDDLARRPKPTDRIFYRQYDKKNTSMIAILKQLTGGKFRDGAIARILLNEFWRKGVAPTYRTYAAGWLKAKHDHKRPNPEWAFLSDKADRKDTKDWKTVRTKKAKQVLRVLDGIEPKQST